MSFSLSIITTALEAGNSETVESTVISSNTTLTDGGFFLIDASTAEVEIVLPEVAEGLKPFKFFVQEANYLVKILPSGSDTINKDPQGISSNATNDSFTLTGINSNYFIS